MDERERERVDENFFKFDPIWSAVGQSLKQSTPGPVDYRVYIVSGLASVEQKQQQKRTLSCPAQKHSAQTSRQTAATQATL
jgi:hypothetical protein